MNRIKMTTLAMGVGVATLAGSLFADTTMDTTKNAVEHPVTTMHESEANSADKDVQEFAQQKKEAKARLDQAKTDYEKSLSANGADNSVTKDAKSRLDDAKKEYKKYAKKTAKASQDLKEDTQKVINDKASN